jgi:hypothetical protein
MVELQEISAKIVVWLFTRDPNLREEYWLDSQLEQIAGGDFLEMQQSALD